MVFVGYEPTEIASKYESRKFILHEPLDWEAFLTSGMELSRPVSTFIRHFPLCLLSALLFIQLNYETILILKPCFKLPCHVLKLLYKDRVVLFLNTDLSFVSRLKLCGCL